MDNLTLSIDDEINDIKMGRPHVVILGAGASVAAFPEGDKNKQKLPLMANFIETLNLGNFLPLNGVDQNFENIYSELSVNSNYAEVLGQIEKVVRQYFEGLKLPEIPTLYDHLILSLRSKDVIATFNWDPFLYDACWRNYGKADLPHVVYLHGNVRIGYCLSCKTKGYVFSICSQCKKAFTPSQLLFPITNKNYMNDPFISQEWNYLKWALKSAYMVTIFGYGAPDSDIEAIKLFKEAWGSPEQRELEEIEIIDIDSESNLSKKWETFIFSHHYQIHKNFYESFIANHPRRTCEAMWNQLMEVKFIKDHPLPRNCNFKELITWLEPLLMVERKLRTN